MNDLAISDMRIASELLGDARYTVIDHPRSSDRLAIWDNQTQAIAVANYGGWTQELSYEGRRRGRAAAQAMANKLNTREMAGLNRGQ